MSDSFLQEVLKGNVVRGKKSAGRSIRQMDSAAGDGSGDMSADDAQSAAFTAQVSLNGASAVQQWVDSANAGDYSDGGLADGLLNIIRGLVDGNNDGELDDDEENVYELTADAAWAYASGMGATDDDLDLIFNAEADTPDVEEAAQRVVDLLTSALPDGEDENTDDLNDFAFSDDALQGVQMDAGYRKFAVIRHGRKVKINKRVSGTVHRSSKQKLALQKAQRRSNTASARTLRIKSFKIGKRLGTHKD